MKVQNILIIVGFFCLLIIGAAIAYKFGKTSEKLPRLKQLLSESQWKEANDETYKLMLKEVNRTQEGSLDKDHIDKLPCPLLIEMDRLWQENSATKFGFSVQKNIYLIYLSEGQRLKSGLVEDNRIEFNEEAFNKFGDSVGWREGGKWKKWEELSVYKDPQYSICTVAPDKLTVWYWSGKIGNFISSGKSTVSVPLR